MASELLRLEDIAVITDSLHSTPTYSSQGYPMVRVTDVRDFYLETAGSLRVSMGIYQEFTKREVPKRGDIVFTRVGSYGNSCLAADDKEFCLGQNTALIRPLIDPYYLLFCLKSSFVRKQIESAVVGSTQKTISIKSIKQLLIPIASEEHVEFTSAAMKSIQDKIELNRKTSETLEGIAKALFKSWFVDFDPVRAKAVGRPTGLPNEISELFPDSFEESEMGEIPCGWKMDEIGNVVECVGGSTPSTKESEYWDEGVNHWATPKDLSDLSEPFILDTAKKITDLGVTKISSGVLPVGTVLLSSRAPVGYVAVARVPVSVNQGFIAMKPSALLTTNFLLNWTLANVQQFKDRASGTTFAEISKKAFRPVPVLLPRSEVVSAFTKIVEPLYEKVVLNMKQSASLTALRDALLPRLISGELRVPDAEKMLEEVGI